MEKKPTATRHIILIRHGQYNLKSEADEDRILTELGQFSSSSLFPLCDKDYKKPKFYNLPEEERSAVGCNLAIIVTPKVQGYLTVATMVCC